MPDRMIGRMTRAFGADDGAVRLMFRNLRFLMIVYSYYNDDRIHDALNKDAPNGRRVEQRPSPAANIISQPRLGGLHHR